MARTQVRGTNGNDILSEGRQASSDIFGFGGDDQIFLNRNDDLGGDNFVDAGAGNDQVLNRFEGGNGILLGAGNDIYVSDGFAFSSGGFDVVHGNDGNDTIAVSTFHSSYFGDAGNDLMMSVGWQNGFDGGVGKDTISYELRDEDATLGGTGVAVNLGAGVAQTGNSRTETLLNIENAIGTGVADTLIGSTAANKLTGGNGNDLLQGLNGKDVLSGGNGNDQLEGGAHQDILNGGAGFDLLFGGAAADVFDFNKTAESARGAQRDQIRDFSHAAADLIDLSGIDANTGASGNQAFSFIGGAFFHDQAGELRFSGGILAGDINGDGRSDFEIAVTGVSAMVNADFLL